jgi:glycosyltransferase involved in cell wall biosynthesis
MLVTCICVCHDKPDLAHEAIGSILSQTYPHWQALVIDSGVLYDAGYYEQFPWRTDRRIRLFRSNETPELRRTKAMAPWCFNEAFRRGWVKGELVVYLCDDDILYPNAFETFVSNCRRNPDAQAMYASQDLGMIYPNGWRALVGERRASGIGGRICRGRPMDSEVDYLQFCHRTEVLRQFPNDEYWPEEKATEEHADGIFMERIGSYVPIHPIDVKVSQNRRTPRSANVGLPALHLADCLANGIPLLPGCTQQADDTPTGSDLPLVTVCVSPRRQDLIASQTYPRLEVLVADTESAAELNSLLAKARGKYLLHVKSAHSACPDAIERMVIRMRARPNLSAVTSYLAAFESDGDLESASLKNVRSPAMYRTADLRAVGGFDDGHEWAVFSKLVNSGRSVDILPEHLFFCSAPSVLQPFVDADRAMAAEKLELWSAMAGYEKRLSEMSLEYQRLQARLGLLRYRIVDALHALLRHIPGAAGALKRIFRGIGKLFGRRIRFAKAAECEPAILIQN